MLKYKQIEIDSGYVGKDLSMLCCPRCGEIYLHHEGVISYDRSEDAEKVVKTTTLSPVTDAEDVKATTTSVEVTDGIGNPSDRRHGLAIAFWCECCSFDDDPNDLGNAIRSGRRIELTIAQHKGSTHIGWRFDD